jgi:hypothetical protein
MLMVVMLVLLDELLLQEEHSRLCFLFFWGTGLAAIRSVFGWRRRLSSPSLPFLALLLLRVRPVSLAAAPPHVLLFLISFYIFGQKNIFWVILALFANFEAKSQKTAQKIKKRIL